MAMKKKTAKTRTGAPRTKRASKGGAKKTRAKGASRTTAVLGATPRAPVVAASAVQRKCKPGQDKLAVQLDVSRGEKIRYEVRFRGAQATFAIVDQHGIVILSNQDPPIQPGLYVRVWPGPNDVVKVPDDLNHVCGMHFIAATDYALRATRVAANGNALEPLKDCVFTRSNQTDSFFDPLRIFTA